MPPNASEDSVTASDLARHFGQWQRRALKTPVYVLNHGRPQFVLASIEFMRALSAGRAGDAGDERAELLDALLDPVAICDAEGRIVIAGRAARLFFGKDFRAGALLTDAMPTEHGVALGMIVARVAHGGIAERGDMPATADRPRLELVVEPCSLGVVIVGRAAGIADARDTAVARAAALEQAIEALPGHAAMTIGPRGRLIAPGASLARLVGIPQPALAEAAAIGLFSTDSRRAVDPVLEAVFTDGMPRRADGDLTTGDGGSRPVTIGLAALRHGNVIAAVQAIVTSRDCA